MPAPLARPCASGLHRFAVLTALATLALLGVGGLVTSNGVGLAVPDWPNTYGYNMFFFPVSQWVGGIFYEHTHRLVASGVGLMTTALALWLYGKTARPFMRWLGVALLALGLGTWLAASRRWADGVVLGVTGLAILSASFVWPRCEASAKWLRRLGVTAFIAVVLQGLLGGLRVVLFKDALGIFHAALAQLFFVLVCAIALFTSRWWQSQMLAAKRPVSSARNRSLAALRWCLAGTTALILGQLILGATMRHQHAGLAIPDFPLAYGRLWPAMDAASVARYNQQRLEVRLGKPDYRRSNRPANGPSAGRTGDSGRGRFQRLVRPTPARREESPEPNDAGLARVDSDAGASGSGHDMVRTKRRTLPPPTCWLALSHWRLA